MMPEKDIHHERHKKKEVEPYLAKSIGHLVIVTYSLDKKGRYYCPNEYKQKIERPYPQDPSHIKMPDTDFIGLLLLLH